MKLCVCRRPWDIVQDNSEGGKAALKPASGKRVKEKKRGLRGKN